MKKSINEIGYNWRLCGDSPFGGCDYVEIDIHNNNFRPATRKTDATIVRRIIWGKHGRYIRFRQDTWYLDDVSTLLPIWRKPQ